MHKDPVAEVGGGHVAWSGLRRLKQHGSWAVVNGCAQGLCTGISLPLR